MVFMRFSISILFLLLSTSLSAEELAYVREGSSGESYSQYLNKQGIPVVRISGECTKNGESCWTVIVNQSGRKLKSFGSKDSVSQLASGRYSDIAYLLVSRVYSCGDKTCSKYLLIDSKGQVKDIGTRPWEGIALATRIGPKGTLYAVTWTNFILRQLGQMTEYTVAPELLLSAEIGFNIDGGISAIVVAESGRVFWSDGKQWKLFNISLAPHGDRMGVAAIFPWNHNAHYIVLYRYVNEYNKGLFTFRFNPTTGKEVGGWLFNSEDRNIGFDPSIYRRRDGGIVVAAQNSSQDNSAFFILKDSDFTKMNPKLPTHVLESGFAEEKPASFMLGSGISQLSWIANSKVKKDDVTHIDVDYLIAESLFRSINFEGRIGDTSLAIQYLQNEAEDLVADDIDSGGGSTSKKLSKQASKYLFSTIDFYGLLSSTSILRIQAEMGETNGIAEVSFKDGSVRNQDFSTKMKRISALVIMERGYFIGADYIKYNMPSAIGFSDSSKSIVYSNFDSDFGFQALRLVGGYDAFAYAKRYETDYHRPYLSGSGNIGLGWAKISSQIEQDALASTGANEIDGLPIYLAMGIDLELGYLWQQRFKRLKGFGYSIGLGYRGSYSLFRAGQSEDSEPEAGTLSMEFERKDLMHGPFLKANIIF